MTQGSTPQASHTSQWRPRQPLIPDEGHGPYFRKDERLKKEVGAGESKRTRLPARAGEPESLRRRRPGDWRAGERRGLEGREREPEREATATKACCDFREEEVCVSDSRRATSESAKRVEVWTAGAESIALLCTSEK